MTKPTTRIGTPLPDNSRFLMRGKDVLGDIMGKMTFTETFFFIVCGREPTPDEVRIFDAALIILIDHGITPHALVSRLVENAVPTDIQVSVAAGLLLVGNRFAGTMAGCGQILSDCMAQDGDKREFLEAKVAELRADNKFVPGFGHPYYKPEDPRATRLFEIARENSVKGEFIELVHVLGEEVDKAMGKHLTMNVTGGLAAVLSEISFPVEVMRSCSVIGRAAGLVAHVYEEKTNPIVGDVMDFAYGVEYLEP